MLQKIQRITIPEGGRARGFTAGKIETALQGGGSCLWVPESAVRTGRLYVHKNGVHKLGGDYYGAGEVVVNVNGYASNGDRMIYPGPGGRLVEDNSPPVLIQIDTLPDKLEYEDGERIDLTGIVVRAYKANGEVWTSRDYPDGVIPVEKLIYNPKTADYSKAEYFVYEDKDIIAVSVVYQFIPTGTHPDVWGGSFALGTLDGQPVTVGGSVSNSYAGPAEVLIAKYGVAVYAARISGDNRKIDIYTLAGRLKVGTSATTRLNTWHVAYDAPGYYLECFTRVPQSKTRPAGAVGSMTKHAKLPITIGWPRPMDNHRLEAVFDITVNDPEGGN